MRALLAVLTLSCLPLTVAGQRFRLAGQRIFTRKRRKTGACAFLRAGSFCSCRGTSGRR